jgi:hypothetical protein
MGAGCQRQKKNRRGRNENVGIAAGHSDWTINNHEIHEKLTEAECFWNEVLTSLLRPKRDRVFGIKILKRC